MVGREAWVAVALASAGMSDLLSRELCLVLRYLQKCFIDFSELECFQVLREHTWCVTTLLLVSQPIRRSYYACHTHITLFFDPCLCIDARGTPTSSSCEYPGSLD